jgi:hypothetical protein
MRKPASRGASLRAPTPPIAREARPATFPAPVGGWIRNVNLATPGARLPDGSKVNGAFALENFFPTTTGARIRGGSELFATVGDGTEDVLSLFDYVSGNNRKLFAATETAIYDITSPAVPDASPAADVDLQTGGDWSVAQIANGGGVFLRCVNGTDTPQLYDGTDWTTSPAITGVAGGANTLSHVWTYKQRLFAIKKDSLSAYYLAADAIGGAATELPLGGVFKRGGSLLFGAIWSIESGNGPAEYCVFVSTEGEAAVYQGTDPGTSATWSRVGVYRIGKPLGPKAVVPAGGDFAIATDIGLVPLSQAVQRDFAAIAPVAISYKIEEAWNEAVRRRPPSGWSCEIWPTEQMLLVTVPTGVGDQPQMLVANTRTGGWGLYTGWNGKCLKHFQNRLFFGSESGKVIEGEVTGADLGVPYTATCVWLFENLKTAATLKASKLMRALLRSSVEKTPQLSLQADYAINLPPAPDDSSQPSGDVWGAGKWGVAKWGLPKEKRVFGDWQSVGGGGCAIAPGLQLTSGALVRPDDEIIQVDVTYELADIVT